MGVDGRTGGSSSSIATESRLCRRRMCSALPSTTSKASNRTVGLFIPSAGPDRADVPGAPDRLVTRLKGYTGRGAAAVGEAFDASPSGIEARVRRTTLPGGLKVVLLPKETRGNTVVATLQLRFGDVKNLMGQSATGQLTAQMLMRGTTRHTRQQIQDELDRLRARIGVNGSGSGASITIQTVREHLAATIELAAELLRQPAFPARELDTLRQQRLAALEEQRTEPSAIVPRAFRRHLFNHYPKGDVRYVPTVDEELAEVRAVGLEDLRRFIHLLGASQGEFAIVGDFDVDEALKIVSTRLDGWRSASSYEDVTMPYRKVPPASQVVETPDKANAVFLAGALIGMRDDHPDYPAMLFANYLTGQGINSRLFARVRGKEGLSYGIGSTFAVPSNHDGAVFQVSANIRRQRLQSRSVGPR